MKRALLLFLLAGPDAGHVHCWHYSNAQHSIPCHSDQVCCLCGESRCSHTEGCYIGPPPGHGPYAPGGLQFLIGTDGGYVINLTSPTSARDGGR